MHGQGIVMLKRECVEEAWKRERMCAYCVNGWRVQVGLWERGNGGCGCSVWRVRWKERDDLGVTRNSK